MELIQTFNAQIVEKGTVVGVMDSRVHSESFENFVRSINDINVELTLDVKENVARFMRVTKYSHGAHPRGWIPYEVTEKGVILKAELEGETARS